MKKNYLFAILTVTALAACTGDDLQGQDAQATNAKITFSATTDDILVEDEQGTRGTGVGEMLDPIALTGADQELWLCPVVSKTVTSEATRGALLGATSEMDAFGVSAYKHAKTTDITGAYPDYFYNLKASKSGTTYQIAQDYYWPSSEEFLTFNAYYPYNSGNSQDGDNTDVVLSGVNQAGQQTVTYTVNETVSAQADLMTAIAANQTPNTTAPSVALQFKHQLAAIRFVVGGQFATKGYIQSITLKNVFKRGIYTIGAEVGSDWTLDADNDKGDVTLTYQNQDKSITGVVGQELNAAADNETFLMIPTSFAANSDAAVWITYWSAGTPNTSSVIKASLAGKSWEAGKTYTYEISSEKLTTLQIKNITFATTPAGAPRTGWETGDQVGLYVVKTSEGNGLTLRYSNVPCTYDKTTGKWSIAQVNSKPVIKYPGDSYYLYYPYDASLQGAPSDGAVVNATADEFFNSVKEAHSVLDNQESMANFINSDLQITKAVAPENTGGAALPASNISAEMARQVGLARLKFATSKEITTTITRTNNGTPSNSGKTTIYPSSNFLGKVPNHSGTGGIYYFYTNAGEETTFNSVASDPNHWYQARNITLAAGAYTTDAEMNENLIQDYRYQWEFVTAIYDYSYTGSASSFTVPIYGTSLCKMECWGASGGTVTGTAPSQDFTVCNPGKGGYTYGELSFNIAQNTSKPTFYLYVGGKGGNGNYNKATSDNTRFAGGWNGGGYGENCSGAYNLCSGGGGATDIRITNGSWDNSTSLASRIMVAGGGGGFSQVDGGDAGGLTGGHVDGVPAESGGYGGTQSDGGIRGVGGGTYGVGQDGGFGYGGHGYDRAGGGGGGYYGGGGGCRASTDGGGGGGSSYISGYEGCAARNDYVFDNPSMTGGLWSGNGKARITVTYE